MPAPTPHAGSSEGVAFLQQRVAAFGLMAAILGGVFWVFRMILALSVGWAARGTSPEYSEITSAHFALHGLGIFFSLLLWFLCRGAPRSRRFVERAEVACLLASVVCYEAMGALIEVDAHPELIILLALTLLMLGRAVYVPGTARRSLVLGVVAGVPLVISMFWAYFTAPAPPGESPLVLGGVSAAVTATWWSMTVTLTTATSHVIYGLRRDARAARQLGQYTLEERIGEGGMGIVYRASHAMLRRPTAVKLLLPERASDTQLARFEREVQLSSRLTHPNTITIFDYGRTPEGIFYYAMELLEGATLEAIVEYDGPQPAERVARVLEQVAGALAEAHGIGLVHRDIKPANIILCDQGGVRDVAKVLDFGLVKQLKQPDGADATFATGDHAITGTPLYMSPESIVQPDQADGRSDLYSLGAVAYYLLTGQHVFMADNAIELFSQHLHKAPVAPEERLGAPVPEALSALILRCLAKEPGARPASAAALRSELGALGLSRGWTHERAREWWDTHEKHLRERRTKAPSGAPPRTIVVDLAHRFDRLEKYLSDQAG
jgi:eukaryotic-like serine/threonine-protein kinase